MVEWCKCRARAQHWVEEIRLLAEEMRRLIAFNETMIAIWDRRREPGVTVDVGEEHKYASDGGWVDGARAYACKQASIRRRQVAKWRREFADSWKVAERFLALHTPEGFSIEPLVFLSPEELTRTTHRTERPERPVYATPDGYKDVDGDDDDAAAVDADGDEEGWGEEVEGDWEGDSGDDDNEAEDDVAATKRQDGTVIRHAVPQESARAGRTGVQKQQPARKKARAARPRRTRTAAKGAQRSKKVD